MSLNNEVILANRKDDEIDLLELFGLLWRKKWWVLLSGLIGAVLAGVYTFTAKEEWTSKTEIIPPNASNLGDYLTLRKEYARIVGEPLDAGTLSATLYGNFDLFLHSLDDREEFLKSSPYFQSQLEGKTEEQKHHFIYNFARKNINIVKPDPKKEPDTIGRKISLTAENPALAQSLLKDYLNVLSTKAFRTDISAFQIAVNEKIKDLTFEYEVIGHNQVVYKNIQLRNLDKAYLTAQKAGIKEYSRAISLGDNTAAIAANVLASDAKIPLSDSQLSDSSYLFMLGERYLKAQIDTLSNKSIIYPARYYEIERQLDALKPISDKLNSSKAMVVSINYLSSPDYPFNRDKPKRLIILLVGLFMGVLISIITILILSMLRKLNYKLK